MKKKLGILIGFIIGFGGFLLLFKLIFLPRISPSDELAPGAVMIIAAIAGIICSFIGNKLQKGSKIKY